MVMEDKVCGVYMIQSKAKPERIYIGSSNMIRYRWSKHKNRLLNGNHHNPKLQAHYNKYGYKDFVFSVIEVCDKDNLIAREQHYIDILNPWFNICPIAGEIIHRPCTEEQKEHLRKINTGKKQSEETIARRVAKNRGQKRKFTEEHLAHMRASVKRGKEHHRFGKPSPCKGRPSTLRGIPLKEEHKAKLRRKRSKETCERIKQSWIKRKIEGKVNERDEFGKFKNKSK